MTRVAFVDAAAGCAGDMFLGALVDAGLPLSTLEDVVRRLRLDGVTVTAQRVNRGALRATKVDVRKNGQVIEGDEDAHAHDEHRHGHGTHRTLKDVLAILSRLGDLDTPPLSWARDTFVALADAEGRVHGKPADEVHFHEVGMDDALVDIAGTCLGLHALGVEEVRVSPLPWGRGSVHAAHGDMALPAPATALLMEGRPTTPSDATYEEVTPTGAALVRALASGDGVPAGFVPSATGFGAGTLTRTRLPNVVRLVVGDVASEAPPSEAVQLETNLDDATAQVSARALERVLEEGALDAWLTPATMKKGRQGAVLSVLVRPEDAARIETVLFRETPTLGVRRHAVRRTVLARRHETVATPWGDVRIKVRETPDGAEGTPEFEDARKLADEHDVPVRRVLDAAQRAWSSGS